MHGPLVASAALAPRIAPSGNGLPDWVVVALTVGVLVLGRVVYGLVTRRRTSMTSSATVASAASSRSSSSNLRGLATTSA